MPDGLILVVGEMTTALDIYLSAIDGLRWMGLMKGEPPPQKTWTTVAVVPATFSGYGGVQVVQNWLPAVLEGTVATARANPIVWQHDGGAGSCVITGLYVVDGNGKLCWAEQFPRPWRTMAFAGDRFTVTPRFGQGSRYPTED